MMEFGCGLFALAVIAGLIALLVSGFKGINRKQAALMAAQKAYRESLDRLRSQPADPTVRTQTLERGRYFAGLAREGGAVAMFDEMALMNDINAACAATTVSVGDQPRPEPSAPSRAASVEERLQKLKSLRDRGVIDEEEYRTKRSEILRDV